MPCIIAFCCIVIYGYTVSNCIGFCRCAVRAFCADLCDIVIARLLIACGGVYAVVGGYTPCYRNNEVICRRKCIFFFICVKVLHLNPVNGNTGKQLSVIAVCCGRRYRTAAFVTVPKKGIVLSCRIVVYSSCDYKILFSCSKSKLFCSRLFHYVAVILSQEQPCSGFCTFLRITHIRLCENFVCFVVLDKLYIRAFKRRRRIRVYKYPKA